MMIGSGCDVRTVASRLGHASVSMTLDTYAGVDPEAKRAVVSKATEDFDVDMSFPDASHDEPDATKAGEAAGLTFTVEQLQAMLAEAEKREASHADA